MYLVLALTIVNQFIERQTELQMERALLSHFRIFGP